MILLIASGFYNVNVIIYMIFSYKNTLVKKKVSYSHLNFLHLALILNNMLSMQKSITRVNNNKNMMRGCFSSFRNKTL